ncbi:hypothetical protein C7H85_06240 [Zobellella endophytica]|uniref:Uncharacterized protein n=1 Tax=Zobellella endophytica TaxID=2116700 RepID=A0A2P7R7R0_9GAMM|nr:hypothetical protein C7H85_06240 [Zobellella endophytica]
MRWNKSWLEAGSWKLEAGSWKLEAGSWKLEAGSWKRIYSPLLPASSFSLQATFACDAGTAAVRLRPGASRTRP